MDEDESSSWRTRVLSLFGNSSTRQQGEHTEKESADNCESSSAKARTSQRFHIGSSQDKDIVEPVRRNSERSITGRNECDVYEAPTPQRENGRGTDSKMNINVGGQLRQSLVRPQNTDDAKENDVTNRNPIQRRSTFSQSSQPGANNNASSGTGDTMRRRLNSLNTSQRNAKVNPDTNPKFRIAEPAVNDSNNVQNKGIPNRNRNQGKTSGQNNARKPNIFHGDDNKHPQNSVGAQANGNRNQRRAAIRRTSHQSDTADGNSVQGDIVRRRFTNSVDASKSTGKNSQKQQFRNTSDRPESSNSNTARNIGQANRNRNQGSESHGRSTGGGSGNGNFHRRNNNNQPT